MSEQPNIKANIYSQTPATVPDSARNWAWSERVEQCVKRVERLDEILCSVTAWCDAIPAHRVRRGSVYQRVCRAAELASENLHTAWAVLRRLRGQLAQGHPVHATVESGLDVADMAMDLAAIYCGTAQGAMIEAGVRRAAGAQRGEAYQELLRSKWSAIREVAALPGTSEQLADTHADRLRMVPISLMRAIRKARRDSKSAPSP